MSRLARSCILVTGSSGFIGSNLLAALAEQVGTVRAGKRFRTNADPLPCNAISCSCDLDDGDQTKAAISGSDLVVHTAYGSHVAMPDHCRTLLAAMSATGTSHLVYLSSIAVYGSAEGSVSESAPLSGNTSTYGEAKKQCEAMIREWVAEQPTLRRAVILRPGIVYGEGSGLWIDKMIERIRSGAWGTFGRYGYGIAALVHVDDVAEIIVRACAYLLEASENSPPVSVMNVVGPDTPTWNEYFQALATADSRIALREISSYELSLRAITAKPAKVWRKIGLPKGNRIALAPTLGELRLFSLKANYVVHNSELLLRFKPSIGLQEGLRRSLRG